jgi:hypothetical protein
MKPHLSRQRRTFKPSLPTWPDFATGALVGGAQKSRRRIAIIGLRQGLIRGHFAASGCRVVLGPVAR